MLGNLREARSKHNDMKKICPQGSHGTEVKDYEREKVVNQKSKEAPANTQPGEHLEQHNMPPRNVPI